MDTVPWTRRRQPPHKSGDPFDAIAPALFRSMGVDGVYARTALYEDIIERLAAFISRHREPAVEVMRFPPVMSRDQLEKGGYLSSFPNLLGCVCALHGTEAEIRTAAGRYEGGGDWTTGLAPGRSGSLARRLLPALPLGCRARSGSAGWVAVRCRRGLLPREPSRSLDRLQSFRMREYVCIGSPDVIMGFPRALDGTRAGHGRRPRPDLPRRCGERSLLRQDRPDHGRRTAPAVVEIRMLVPLRSAEQPTACMSFNYHLEHFGAVWGLRHADGSVAHTGCVAFGMDRLAVALFTTHGVDLAGWPASVRAALAF